MMNSWMREEEILVEIVGQIMGDWTAMDKLDWSKMKPLVESTVSVLDELWGKSMTIGEQKMGAFVEAFGDELVRKS